MSNGHFEAWFRVIDKDQGGDIDKEEMINLIKKIGKFGQAQGQKSKLSLLSRSTSNQRNHKGHQSATKLSLARQQTPVAERLSQTGLQRFQSASQKILPTHKPQTMKEKLSEIQKNIKGNSIKMINIDGREQLDTPKSIRKIVDSIWLQFDEDNNGVLDIEEARKFFNAVLTKFKGNSSFSSASFGSWMAILDKNNTGSLDKIEVSDFITKMLGYEMENKSASN